MPPVLLRLLPPHSRPTLRLHRSGGFLFHVQCLLGDYAHLAPLKLHRESPPRCQLSLLFSPIPTVGQAQATALFYQKLSGKVTYRVSPPQDAFRLER